MVNYEEKTFICIFEYECRRHGKALISLLNELSSEKYDIDLLLFENQGRFLNDIPEYVNVSFLEEYKHIKKAVNNPPLDIIKENLKKSII